VTARTLPGGRCATLAHKGAYSELSRSYKQISEYIKSENLKPVLPSREIYLKGPGIIFKGNPKNYLTEIQFFF
jgi:effector-binding domain-containing protein